MIKLERYKTSKARDKGIHPFTYSLAGVQPNAPSKHRKYTEINALIAVGRRRWVVAEQQSC